MGYGVQKDHQIDEGLGEELKIGKNIYKIW
jgi:hypothetical protein